MSRFPSVLLILVGLACGVTTAVGAETRPRYGTSETKQPSDVPEAKAPRSGYIPPMIVRPPADAFPSARGRDPSAQRETPVDPNAPMVMVQMFVAEMSVEDDAKTAPAAKTPRDGDAAGKPAQASAFSEVAGVDLSASDERIQAILRGLGVRGRMETSYRVQLASADRQKASLQLGQSQAVVVGAMSSQFGQTNQVSYQNTGFLVLVRPQVDPGKIITVDVDINASRLGNEAEGTPISISAKGDTLRARPTHQFATQTTVRVPDGKTVLFSGLSRQSGARRQHLVILLSAQITMKGTEPTPNAR